MVSTGADYARFRASGVGGFRDLRHCCARGVALTETSVDAKARKEVLKMAREPDVAGIKAWVKAKTRRCDSDLHDQ